MTRNMILQAAMVAMMAMASVNAYADNRGDKNVRDDKNQSTTSAHGGGLRGESNTGNHAGSNNHSTYDSRGNAGSGNHSTYDNRGNHAGSGNSYAGGSHATTSAHNGGLRGDDGIRHGHERYVDRQGWYPGYKGRVRYIDGRWAYWRNNSWYYYDCFYEPDYYYNHHISTFEHHLSPLGRKVVGGIVGGVIAGAILTALCR